MTAWPPEPSALALPALGVAMVWLAGLVRGFSGFGFSIAAVPLLSLIYPPVQVVPVVMLLQLFVSFNGLGQAWPLADRPSLWRLALGALVATPVGLWGLTSLPAAPVRLAIAAIVAIAVAILAGGRRMAAPPGGAAVFGFGIVSGLFNGLAGIPGPPVIAFYLASHLPTAAARASMIVLFMFTSLAALLPLVWGGRVGVPELVAAAAGFPAVWLGSRQGARMYLRSHEARYRRIALLILGLAGALAALRAVLDLVA